MFSKEKIALVVAETVGTFILASVAIAASIYFNATAAWYVSLSVGFTLAVLVGTIGRVSGAHVNPAVTLGLWTLRKIPSAQALVYVAAQILGGALALAYFEFATDSDLIQTGFSTVDARIFTAEMIGAAIFGFGIAAAVTQKLEGYMKAFTIGMSLTLGILVASVAAPGFLNPAVALANNTWDKTVVIAPLLGVVVGMNLYSLMLAPAEKTVSLRGKKKK